MTRLFDTNRLIDICICLALMHWASAPFWAALLIFIALQINRNVQTLATLLVAFWEWTAQEKDAEQAGPYKGLHSVDNDPAA